MNLHFELQKSNSSSLAECIQVYDGVFASDWCEDLISYFETSIHYRTDDHRKQSDQLQFQPETGQWLLNGAKVYLQTQQFLTRNLLVMNLYTETGRRINQVIPIDSMPRTQHIRLRKLIIAWSKSANRDGQLHPDRRN